MIAGECLMLVHVPITRDDKLQPAKDADKINKSVSQ
jgi:hypothetical protein